MDLDNFTTLYKRYSETGDYGPVLDQAPKADHWGQTTPPLSLAILPQGKDLFERLVNAYSGKAPLSPSLYFADWSTLPK